MCFKQKEWLEGTKKASFPKAHDHQHDLNFEALHIQWNKDLQSFNDDSLKSFVHNNINKQIVDMFRQLEEYNDFVHLRKSSMAFKSKEQHLLDTVGFTLKLHESTIANAGSGVFMSTSNIDSNENKSVDANGVVRDNIIVTDNTSNTTVVPTSSSTAVSVGTVVALYPGLVHLKEHLINSSYRNKLFPDPDFMLIARRDEVVIDGRTANNVSQNPFALGHKINHCGSHRKANVIQVC